MSKADGNSGLFKFIREIYFFHVFWSRLYDLLPNRMKSFFKVINEYKNSLIIVLSWLIISIISENPFLDTVNQVIRFFLYPINFIIYRTDFSTTTIPQIFFFLIPIFFVFTIGFLYLISTED